MGKEHQDPGYLGLCSHAKYQTSITCEITTTEKDTPLSTAAAAAETAAETKAIPKPTATTTEERMVEVIDVLFNVNELVKISCQTIDSTVEDAVGVVATSTTTCAIHNAVNAMNPHACCNHNGVWLVKAEFAGSTW